jgi:undecaprenyl diphosphate synthase
VSVPLRADETEGRLAALGLDAARLPRHIAIIMDGNGRWARRRGLPRVMGHRRGVESVRAVIEECCRLGVGQLTLYCLSSENWKRPRMELDFLMRLLRQYVIDERREIMDQDIRFTTIGQRAGIPEEVWVEVDKTIELSRNNQGTVLCLAINYGARQEIVQAVRRIVQQVQAGHLTEADIDEDQLNSQLYTRGMPDPDLVIRTAGEMRVSNFLLWQISYSELWVTPVLWPDFRESNLHEALRDFAGRERRFGGLDRSC